MSIVTNTRKGISKTDHARVAYSATKGTPYCKWRAKGVKVKVPTPITATVASVTQSQSFFRSNRNSLP